MSGRWTEVFEIAERIKKAAEGATPGPWAAHEPRPYRYSVRGEDALIADYANQPDMDFIATARNDAPALAEFILGPVRELVDALRPLASAAEPYEFVPSEHRHLSFIYADASSDAHISIADAFRAKAVLASFLKPEREEPQT